LRSKAAQGYQLPTEIRLMRALDAVHQHVKVVPKQTRTALAFLLTTLATGGVFLKERRWFALPQ